jgi:HAD superfamily hydrolase (TIGR01509 family)
VRSFAAVLFDMDDTLVASAATWKQAEHRLFARLGHDYSPEIASLYKGMNARDVGRTIYRQLRPAGYTDETCGRLLREFLLEGFHGPLTALPGADALVRQLAGRLPLALASGSPLEGIRLVLERFGWTDCFSLIVSSEEVREGKPAPDVFLEAARRLAVPPARVLVIEDSLHGVHAAKRAGMTCFAVPSNPDPRIAAEADRSFISLEEMSLDLCEVEIA